MHYTTSATTRLALFWPLAGFLCACGSDTGSESQLNTQTDAMVSSTAVDGSDAGLLAPTGTVTFTFTLGGVVATSRNLVDELEGPVYGSVFHRTDVNLLGPLEDAEAVETVELESVDLRDRDVSEASWTGELLPGEYTWLGFWDLDHSYDPGNLDDAGAAMPYPEMGDAVSLADTNQFEIVADETLEYTVTFDLIYTF